jgi:multisubunit Na+/H+ antiporter MnhG subunit
MPFAVELSGLLGVFIVLVGAWGVLAPARITDLVNRFGSKGGMWFAAIIRLVLGMALWFAAPQSRAPMLLQALGAIAILAAVVIPLLGAERFKALVDWWGKLSPGAQRLWSLVAVGFGAVILWALLPAAR